MTGYLLQHSPQDKLGFEMFFEQCLQVLNEGESCWVFLRGDGIYQAVSDQDLDEPGFSVPVDGGWNALIARGVQIYVNKRCARLRGMENADLFLEEVQFTDLETLAELSLAARKVVVL